MQLHFFRKLKNIVLRRDVYLVIYTYATMDFFFYLTWVLFLYILCIRVSYIYLFFKKITGSTEHVCVGAHKVNIALYS